MREAIHRLESEGEGWRQSTSFVLQAVREDCDFGVSLLSGRLGCWRYMCCSRSQTFSSPTIVGRQRLQLAYMDPLPLGESCFSEEICRLRVLAAPRPGPGRPPGSLPPADLLSNDRMGISWSARQSARLRCPATSELQETSRESECCADISEDVSGFWARSGAAASHTDANGYPAVLAPGFGDMATGLAAVGGTRAACECLLAVTWSGRTFQAFARPSLRGKKTGKGMVLSTSLLRTGVHCNSWAP